MSSMPPLLSRLNSTQDNERARAQAELRDAITFQRRLYQLVSEDKRQVTGRVYTHLAAQTLERPWDSVLEVHRDKLVGSLVKACLIAYP